MTPIIDRAITAHRQYIRRTHGRHQPAAFLIHPKDEKLLGNEMRWLTPHTAAVMPEVLEPTYKYIKGIAVYADPRVPRGHVALLKHGAV